MIHKKIPVIALIPARGGSKGIPRKNIRILQGKPLLAWTIEAARASVTVDRVVVSTEDPDIAAVAEQWGAEVPFRRPESLAADDTPGIEVVLHAIQWFQKEVQVEQDFVVVVLQPTSPLRTTQDIEAALEMFTNPKVQAVVSVCEAEHHPWWMNTLPEDRNMRDFLSPQALNTNRQELPAYYRLNGALFAGYASYIQSHHGFYGPNTYAYIMPQWRSVDIDTEMDWLLAEAILQQKEIDFHQKSAKGN